MESGELEKITMAGSLLNFVHKRTSSWLPTVLSFKSTYVWVSPNTNPTKTIPNLPKLIQNH